MVNNFLKCIFKITDQNSICVSIVFKAETKEKYEENIFLKVFVLKLKNMLFWGSNNFLKQFFFPVLAFNTIESPMFFWSVYLNAQEKKLLTAKKTTKIAFWGLNTVFSAISKIPTKKNICASIVFKAESEPKHEENYLGGFTSKTKNMLFWG